MVHATVNHVIIHALFITVCVKITWYEFAGIGININVFYLVSLATVYEITSLPCTCPCTDLEIHVLNIINYYNNCIFIGVHNKFTSLWTQRPNYP